VPDLKYLIRQCNSCNADIIWARSLHGRAMPVDAEPSPAGTVLVATRQGIVRATVYTADDAARFLRPEQIRELRTSHFATCPDADTWRKRGHA
jgi:hypothetical protein